MKENFVRITYTTPESELTTEGKAARARLEAVINQAVEMFHEETPGIDGLLAIELYPCDEDCEECADALCEGAEETIG